VPVLVTEGRGRSRRAPRRGESAGERCCAPEPAIVRYQRMEPNEDLASPAIVEGKIQPDPRVFFVTG